MSAFVTPSAFRPFPSSATRQSSLNICTPISVGSLRSSSLISRTMVRRSTAPSVHITPVMEFPDEDTDDSAPPVSEPRKLFIGNLSWNTTDETLGNAFADYGRISAKVVVDRFNGRSRGFGFVEFDEPEDATLALEHMDGKELDGREIRVDRATKRLNNRRYN